MVLFEFLGKLLVGVLAMVAIAGWLFLDREQATAVPQRSWQRLREIAPHLSLLVGVLALNRVFRNLGQELSWMLGWNITGLIYTIEGDFVALVQVIATPPLTVFFSFVYLYGYVFLATFPVVAYWLLADTDPIQRTLVAYALNYGIGLVFYTLFVAFGPRNLLPNTVQELLYTAYPQSQILTSTVNTNTNAFPSLHTSLSVTVALLARRTRDVYPGWYALSTGLAALVVVSTMYLGIHWATDVVAGALLAVASVRLADRYHDLPRVGELLPERTRVRTAERRND
ncbi:phosphatase PAP2 family protein [Halomicroarcula sp. S1AR25-4]|uniref:phosphatase PAP2 family protein n=1 Tax=Haloarcula sp. S1AR25-4 TaxID=2950538 RepID=UPI002873F6DC|nr:phosphatase PAP2 family protein [Halomicroarcula sp. S1AR25-4]MDS0279510.1 phosphatase PAP2 family protein [Halomicroarcula sp. S1AR25-4]